MTRDVLGSGAPIEETSHPQDPRVQAQIHLTERQTKAAALDMALRYFPAKTAKQLVENAAVFEAYLTGEHHNV